MQNPESSTPPSSTEAETSPPCDTRRGLVRWAFASFGAAAAGAAFWQWRSLNEAQTVEAPAASSDGVEAAAHTVYRLQFPQPDGSTLAMDSFKGRPLIVNFWATWCPPCVREMPLLNEFARAQGTAGGVRVVGLAIDGPTAVRSYLAQHPVSFPIGLAGMEGTDLARALGNAQGGLPFTVFFDAQGQVLQRKLGETTASDLAQWMGALKN